MSIPRGGGNLQLWGARQQEVCVPPSNPSAPHQSTALYLVSRPLPKNVSTIQFEIISRDQGWGNPHDGLWSWFEVSILGSLAEQTTAEFHDLSDPAHVRPTPEEFGELIQDQGLYFKDIPSRTTQSSSQVSMTIIANAIRRHWQHHALTWRRGSDDETADHFLDLLEEGDRLCIWARAQAWHLGQLTSSKEMLMS
ncbi:uncharacterized protein N7446_010807 [Penicillium canescens]|uniref:Uncharacterized protein n=1 Tax=Penicillium canescens TaxID=5083 RepID=A0AAD6IB02_PENCN|nr:uncharacterized protein N7446_010807 [Penicillium canescens]KAJ6041303.1 hypothetical protein N7460_006693 [Penicillium canescens]KAJ6050698.1 hypothetical protein N7446_010807 [Penicillium canescens]KAJ6065917.1 hypothetical protein N7444_001570 [Penicillium canescens]